MPKRVAYLVNQYPKVSHTFVRREILALEANDWQVERFSVRDTRGEAKDPSDIDEAKKTTVLLQTNQAGVLALLKALCVGAIMSPRGAWAALRMAIHLWRRSDRGLIAHAAYLAEAALLCEHMDLRHCNHVHAHFGTNSTSVALLAHLFGGVTYSFTVHGPEEFDKPDLIALEEKIAAAAFVVAISSFGRSQLMRRTPQANWAKIRIVPCGVDDAFLGKSYLMPLPSAPRLTCVGRLCEQKGQLLLVEAAGILKGEGRMFELVLVGDGEMRPQIEQRIAELGLSNHIRITGWADGATVRMELNAARVMVLPSFAEGLPVVIMEALALERPVISTYVAGIPELVEPGTCGWLVPAGSVEALAGALRAALAADAPMLQAMGHEGRKRVLARHDARYAAGLLASAFTDVGIA